MDLFESDSDDQVEASLPRPRQSTVKQLPAVRPSHLNDRIFRIDPIFASDALGVATDLVGIGGGRGYVATRDVEPGELLLVEQPLFWRGDAVVDSDLLAPLLGETVEEKRRINSFETGLYLYQALFNDAAHPNCIQLFVEEAQVDEVWCFRRVGAGDALVISYAQPPETTLFRRRTLLQHHGFLEPPVRTPLADHEDALDDADLDVALEQTAAIALSDEPDAPLLLRRALAILARLASVATTVEYAESSPGLAAALGGPTVPVSTELRVGVLALRAALAWLSALDRDDNMFHPDAGEAAGIAAEALTALAPRASRALLAQAAGREWRDAGELHAATVALQSRADHIRALFDSRRWLL